MLHLPVLLIFLLMLGFSIVTVVRSFRKRLIPNAVMPSPVFLQSRVPFYAALTPPDKQRFTEEAAQFLRDVRITAVNTDLTAEDQMLIAAAAIVPVFAFRGWRYPNLQEVLVYEDQFNLEFETVGDNDRNILGLVGTGSFRNKMFLSKKALHAGFADSLLPTNTAIHEFVHLIDGADGAIDGVPTVLLDKQYTLPWLELMHREMEKMRSGESDINPYGYSNRQEFFAVAAEYFFEHPERFRENHPELFEMMERIFNQRKN